MKNKKNILKHAVSDKSFPKISPSKTKVPDWFKDSSRFDLGNTIPKRLPYNFKFKACSVFSDSFFSGYMIPLSVDIAVEQSETGTIISWNDNESIFVELRDKKNNIEIPTPEGYSDMHFIWKIPHVYKIPKGYSALVCHPLNRFDLPFLTLSGIVDGEISLHGGNVPVFFSKTFEGVIEAGTPIAQIILFKTENWESKEDQSIIEESEINEKRSRNSSYGWYKKNIWKKKIYE
jgi:hypothetical protein